MRSASPISAAALALLLAACATEAPPLPADTTATNRAKEVTLADFRPEDAALACPAIAAQRTELANAITAAHQAVKLNRPHNQVVLYFSGFFLPLAAAAKTNEDEKDLLVRAQDRYDTLTKLAVVKKC